MNLTIAAPDDTYTGRVTRVVDGDTFDVEVVAEVELPAIFGLSIRPVVTRRLRLVDINCPEKSTGAPGKAATDHTTARLLGQAITFRTKKRDDHDRWLSRVPAPDGADMSVELLSLGLAVPYMVGKGGV